MSNVRHQVKLRSIVLSVYGHSIDVAAPFSFETRSLCNFVQRYARSIEIETAGFNQIIVQDDLHSPKLSSPTLIPEKTLAIPFEFDKDRYRQATSAEKQEYFIEILSAGLEAAHTFHPLPLKEFQDRIKEFRTNGYRNYWVHQSKTIRKIAATAELQCELTLDQFTLTLEIRGKSGSLRRIHLLETKPDELCFHHQFKDIVVREEHLVVTNRRYSNDELARFPLASLSAIDA